MTYVEYKRMAEEEVNKLPIFFAFSKEQFYDACEKRNIKLDGSTKLVAIGGGAYCTKEDWPIVKASMEEKDPITELMKDYDFAFDAIYYEMGNHEYHINYYQGDYDVCSCFGNCEWAGEEANGQYYLEQMGYGEETIRAYKDARRQFLKDADEKGWY